MADNKLTLDEYKQLLSGGCTGGFCLFCDGEDNFITRGETATQTINFSFDSNLVSSLYISYQQKGITLLEKNLTDLSEATWNCDLLIYNLTEQETLRFKADVDLNVEISIKFINNEIIKTSSKLNVIDSNTRKISDTSLKQISLQADIRDQNISIVKIEDLISGSRNINYAVFLFDTTWEKFEKKAIFKDEYEHEIEQGIVNNECMIPNEVLEGCGKLYIKIKGVNHVLGGEDFIKNTNWSNSIRIKKGN